MLLAYTYNITEFYKIFWTRLSIELLILIRFGPLLHTAIRSMNKVNRMVFHHSGLEESEYISIFSGLEKVKPVTMNGKKDTLWSTELAQIFGLSRDYLSIGDITRTDKVKLLGDAWDAHAATAILSFLIFFLKRKIQ